MPDTLISMCRICANHCPLTIERKADGEHRVSGVKGNPLWRGYTCIKGRNQIVQMNHADRLLHSLIRVEGRHVPVSSDALVAEVAARLTAIIDRFGPNSVALYTGNGLIAGAGTAGPVGAAFLAAMGSTRQFTSVTLDKPGKSIAKSLHGGWGAPAHNFDRPGVALFVGVNPLVTYTGLPSGNPGKWLNEQLDAGMQLIVIDPRRSDVAKRATLHLQARPGSDVEVLTAMIRVILAEDLMDADFVARYTTGLEALREHVDPYTVERVAQVAGVVAGDIVSAARVFAGAQRGFVMGGTGPHMAGYGTLAEYLLLDLETLCGHWLRAGERVPNAGALLPAGRHVAQPVAPSPARYGERLRTRGLRRTAAGLPTAALPDEMLAGEIRALISIGGNPVASWPDQLKTIDALDRLELFVQVDPWLTASARQADYVVAPPMPLEVASTSVVLDVLNTMGTGYSTVEPYAQYTDAVFSRPEGADLIEEWEFLYELARAMGLRLRVPVPGGEHSPEHLDLDMACRPSTEELITQLSRHSRIPLEEVKRHPGGGVFAEPYAYVEPGDPDCPDRMQLADPGMMAELDAALTAKRDLGDEWPYRLICRRMMHVYNSMGTVGPQTHRRQYNPAFMSPADLDRLALAEGDLVTISSRRASIVAVVHPDDTLSDGVVSMAFGFGGAPDRDSEYLTLGSNTNRLIDNDVEFDQWSGQPRMSNVPVAVRPHRPSTGA